MTSRAPEIEQTKKPARTMTSALDQLQERARRDDGDTLVLVERLQVGVCRHDHVGAALDRRGQDGVVLGVAADTLGAFSVAGEIGERREVRQPEQRLVWLAEVLADLQELARA